MLKSLIVLVTFLSVVNAQAIIFNEEQLSAMHLLEASIEETVQGGKNAINLKIAQLELQLFALKAAKTVITDDGSRYVAVLIGTGAMAGTGALAAYLATKAYNLPILSRNLGTRLVLSTLIVLGGMYEVAVLADDTSLIIVLTEEQLAEMIKKVEDRIKELKTYN